MTQFDNTNRGAGWIKDGKNGQYISCKVNVDGKDYNMAIFKNTKRKSEKSPAYNISVLKSKEQNQPSDGFTANNVQTSSGFPADNVQDGDSVPF